jgi:protease YdgD
VRQKQAIGQSERIKPLAFADKSAIAGERLEIGGFAQSRLFAMTADTDCHVKAIFSNGLIGHDCAVMKGDSGAPLLRSNGDEMQVVGVHVGSADFDGVAWEIAVPASNFAKR